MPGAHISDRGYDLGQILDAPMALSCLLYLLYANDMSLCADEGVNLVGETEAHSVMEHILLAGFSKKNYVCCKN